MKPKSRVGELTGICRDASRAGEGQPPAVAAPHLALPTTLNAWGEVRREVGLEDGTSLGKVLHGYSKIGVLLGEANGIVSGGSSNLSKASRLALVRRDQ